MKCLHPILLTALLLPSLPLASQELGNAPRVAIDDCHALDDRGNLARRRTDGQAIRDECRDARLCERRSRDCGHCPMLCRL